MDINVDSEFIPYLCLDRTTYGSIAPNLKRKSIMKNVFDIWKNGLSLQSVDRNFGRTLQYFKCNAFYFHSKKIQTKLYLPLNDAH
jgi:hypothetical protein